MLNIDRLREMSADELSEFLCFSDCITKKELCPAWNINTCGGDCSKYFRDWLLQEVREDDKRGSHPSDD